MQPKNCRLLRCHTEPSNLQTLTYKPFSKPNKETNEINKESNHPPIIQQVPFSMKSQLSSLLSSDCNWNRTQNHLVLKSSFTSPSDFAPASSKEFLDIQATIECGFTLKRVCDMTRTYSLLSSDKIFNESTPIYQD